MGDDTHIALLVWRGMTFGFLGCFCHCKDLNSSKGDAVRIFDSSLGPEGLQRDLWVSISDSSCSSEREVMMIFS